MIIMCSFVIRVQMISYMTYTYMHTYIHTYIHTYAHTYIHIHTYVLTVSDCIGMPTARVRHSLALQEGQSGKTIHIVYVYIYSFFKSMYVCM